MRFGPVEQDREVVLLGDPRALGDHHPVDGVALDVHPEDLGRAVGGLLRVAGQLDAAGLAAAAGLDLGLDDDRPAAELLGGRAGLVRRRGDLGVQHRYAVRGEQIARLVLEQIHEDVLIIEGRRETDSDDQP